MTKANSKQPAAGAKAQQAVASHLLKFEEVSFDSHQDKPTATDEELNSRYAKGEIRIVTDRQAGLGQRRSRGRAAAELGRGVARGG